MIGHVLRVNWCMKVAELNQLQNIEIHISKNEEKKIIFGNIWRNESYTQIQISPIIPIIGHNLWLISYANDLMQKWIFEMAMEARCIKLYFAGEKEYGKEMNQTTIHLFDWNMRAKVIESLSTFLLNLPKRNNHLLQNESPCINLAILLIVSDSVWRSRWFCMKMNRLPYPKIVYRLCKLKPFLYFSILKLWNSII